MSILNPKFVTIIFLFLLFGFKNTANHPLHVSTTEVNFNAKDKTLEISCRIFSDDFESILAKRYKKKTDLANPQLKTQMDELVKNYVINHLQIKANGKPVQLNYIGFEIDHEATNIYLEVEKISNVKTIEVNCSILYDLFDDQLSIVHVVKDTARKSGKILYPDRIFSAKFG